MASPRPKRSGAPDLLLVQPIRTTPTPPPVPLDAREDPQPPPAAAVGPTLLLPAAPSLSVTPASPPRPVVELTVPSFDGTRAAARTSPTQARRFQAPRLPVGGEDPVIRALALGPSPEPDDDDMAPLVARGGGEDGPAATAAASSSDKLDHTIEELQRSVDSIHEKLAGEKASADEVDFQVKRQRRKSRALLHSLKQKSTTDDPQLAYRLAALCLEDALSGRDKHGKLSMTRRSPLVRRAFYLQINKWEKRLFIFAVLLHSSLAFVEDVHPAVGLGLAIPCLLVYGLDIALKMVFMSPRDYLKKNWNLGQVLLTLGFLLDLCLFAAGIVQPLRLLRPWILLCRDRELRRVYQAILAMAPVLVKIILAIFLFILFFAAVGVNTFQGDYNLPGVINLTEEADLTGSFDNILIAFVRLFVLVTTENYPDIMLPAFAVTQRSFFYFGIYVVIGVFYILPMLLAVVMESYWKATAKQVKKDRLKERKKLIECFNYLDPEGKGQISLNDWLGLMNIVRPNLSVDARKFLFSLLKGKDGRVPALAWLEVGSVLKYKLIAKKDEEENNHADKRLHMRLKYHCRRVIDWEHWDTLILALIGLHWILFCVVYRGMPYAVLAAIHGVKSVITFVFLLDIAMRIVVRGIDFEFGTALFGVPISLLEVVTLLLTIMDVTFFWLGICRVAFCGVLGDIAQFFRLLYKSNATLEAISVLNLVWPLSIKLMALMAFVSYSYAILGLELYSDAPFIEPEAPYCAGDLEDPQPEDGNYQEFWCSWLVIFQIITTSNWHNLMNPIMEQRSPWHSIFFISCFVVTNFVILSLMVGVFIDAFFKAAKRKADELATQRKDNLKRRASLTSTTKSRGAKGQDIQTSAIGAMLDGHAQAADIVQKIKDDEESVPRYHAVKDTLKQRMAVNKRKKRASKIFKQQGKVIERCVAIQDRKAHSDNDLPLTKGDVIDILDIHGDRYRGKCHDRAGWFDKSDVLPVLSDAVQQRLAARPSKSELETMRRRSTMEDEDDVDSDTLSDLPSKFILRKGLSRRDMVAGDITNMNPEELRELNSIAKANLLAHRVRKHRVHPAPAQNTAPAGPPRINVERVQKSHDHPCEVCGKMLRSQAQLKAHMRQHKKPSASPAAAPAAVNEPAPRRESLSVPQQRPGVKRSRGPRVVNFAADTKPESVDDAKPKSSGTGEMPDWIAKFAKEKSVAVSTIDSRQDEPPSPSPPTVVEPGGGD